MKRLLSLLLILVGSTAFADQSFIVRSACCPPKNDCCSGEFGLSAEALFWRPIVCNDDYALLNVPFIQTVFAVESEFDVGVRVGAWYDADCWFASARYTWFDSTSSDSQSRPIQDLFIRDFGSEEPVARASESFCYQYQDANLRWGTACSRTKCCTLYAFAEARWVNVEGTRKINGAQLNGGILFSRDHSAFDGGGIGLGIGSKAIILSCLHLDTELGTVGVIGSRRHDYSRAARAGTGPFDATGATYASNTIFVPGLDASVKLSFIRCICNIDFSLFIGWEYEYYWNIIQFNQSAIAFDNRPGTPVGTLLAIQEGTGRCRNIGFGGPTVGVTVKY